MRKNDEKKKKMVEKRVDYNRTGTWQRPSSTDNEIHIEIAVE